MWQLQAFDEQDEKYEVPKYAFSAQFLFKGNSIAVEEGFGWMPAFQTDVISICFQAIKLCETASGKEETMRQLGLLVCFNVHMQEDTVLKRFSRFWRWRDRYLWEKTLGLSPAWPAWLSFPFQDVTAEQNMVGWEPVTWVTSWRLWRVLIKGSPGLQNLEQGTTTKEGQIMWKPKLAEKLSRTHNKVSWELPNSRIQVVEENIPTCL